MGYLFFHLFAISKKSSFKKTLLPEQSKTTSNESSELKQISPALRLLRLADKNTSGAHMSCTSNASESFFQYTNADRSLLMNHVQKHFGTISGIGQTLLSQDRPLEILAVTPPNRKHLSRLFSPADAVCSGVETMLLTFGAGAFSMNVPKDSELPPRAEYLIRLPADWNIQTDDERWAWPVRLLMNIASQPETEQSYNAWGHTFSFTNGTPFAANTKLCAAVLIGMNDREGQCRLSNGESVIFYEVIPLYAEELAFSTEHGPVALIDEFMRYNIPRVVTPQRPNAAILAMHRQKLLRTMNDMAEKDILRLRQSTSSLEETMALEEILGSKQGFGKKTLGLMKNLTASMFRR